MQTASQRRERGPRRWALAAALFIAVFFTATQLPVLSYAVAPPPPGAGVPPRKPRSEAPSDADPADGSASSAAGPPADVTPADVKATVPQPAGGGARAVPTAWPGPARPDGFTAGLRFITVQTGASPGWCRMLRTAALSGVTINNIGWGRRYSHTARVAWIRDWLADQAAAAGKRPAPNADGDDGGGEAPPLRDWDVVMFSDGADTAYTGVRPATILRTFERQNRRANGTAPLMFNAEANCFHLELFTGSWGVNKGRCIAAYKRYNPALATKWRYLNGGAWIGYAWAARRFFADVAAVIKGRPASMKCDQSVMGGQLLSRRYAGLLALDYGNAVFLPTYHLKPAADFCPAAADAAAAEAEGPRRLRMCHSGAVPALLHFNGKASHDQADVLGRCSWAAAAADKPAQDAVVRRWQTVLYGDGKAPAPRKLVDVCPSLSK
jgi:hypothetical protein